MGQFIHKDSQIIIIDNSGNQSVYDATWWMAEEEAAYALPTDAVLQYYRQSDVHAWHSATGVVSTGTLPWADGDTYISKKATYDTDWIAEINSNKTLQQLKDERIALSFNNCLTKKSEKVQISSVNYPTDNTTFARLSIEFEKYNRDGAVPVGYYVYDEDRNQVTKNLAQLETLIDLIVDFYHACDLVHDGHQDAIQALADPSAILAYDYTTGYPVTPYT